MTFILDYWKEFALLALVGVLLYFGYHLKTLTDYATENVALRGKISDLEKANNDLMKFNSDFNAAAKKDISHDKNSCLNRPLPSNISKLLH